MSAPWRRLALGDGILAEAAKARIDAAFRSAWPGGAPPGAAVYVRVDEGAGLHCEVSAFFTPEADAVGDHLGAKPCAPPPAAGLETLCEG